MKDIMKIYNRVWNELNDIGLAPNRKEIMTVKVNPRLTTTYGRCIKIWCTYYIELNPSLLADDVPTDFPARNCMCHELLHVKTECTGHRGRWARAARRASTLLEYDIHTRANYDSYGVRIPERKINYVIRCKKCGQIVGRARIEGM